MDTADCTADIVLYEMDSSVAVQQQQQTNEAVTIVVGIRVC